MSAIPIPQQGDTDDPEELIRRMGASAHNAIPLPDLSAITPTPAQPQLVNKSGHAIPTGRVGGISGTIDPDTSLYNTPPAHQAGVASLWSKAENIHNPVLRVAGKIGAGLLRGIDVAGSVVAPGVAAAIPGSTVSTRINENRDREQAAEDIVNQQKQAVTAGEEENTREAPAKLQIEQRKQDLAEQVARQPKPKEEHWSIVPGVVGPNGEMFQQEENSGQTRPVPGMTGVRSLKEPAESDKQQDIADFLAANKLPDTPANRERARTTIAKRAQQEPGNYMPLYDPKSGTLVGAWDPKSGHHIPAPTLPGTTSAGMAVANKAEERNATANATVNSFTRYQKSFHDLAPKLTDADRTALGVLTSHQDKISEGILGAAQSGVLDTLLGQPLTGYSQKLMGAAMTKDQFDKLSPAGKKMLADYFNAVIQNFGNMKQILGSIGRNPMQLQAEINTIPLPYLDPQTADTMFQDKLEDLKLRNPGAFTQSSNESQPKGGSSSGRRVIDLTK